MAINSFTASGNVGSDMEVRFTPSNKAIGTFSMPVKSGWGDNEKTSWVTCKIFGDRAQKLAPYIIKGTKMLVTGAFVLEEWEKDGVKHSRPVILVNDFDFGSQANQQKQQNSGYQQRLQQGGYQQQPQGRKNQAPPQTPEPDFPMDDDLPF